MKAVEETGVTAPVVAYSAALGVEGTLIFLVVVPELS